MTIRGSNGYFGRAKFWHYLQSLPPTTTVGFRGEAEYCPIAGYISHIIPEHDYDSVFVFDTTISYTINHHEHVHPTPAWVTEFIAHIDGNSLGFSTNPVTAREALAALD